MPNRIQRQRTKGWRMPEGVTYVGRPSKWGNPFRAMGPELNTFRHRLWVAREAAFGLTKNPPTPDQIRNELRGKDLACWCPLDQPCHADVLLEIANG